MTNETLREVTSLENIEETTSEHVLDWTCRVKAQRGWRSMLNNITEAKDFDAICETHRSRWVGLHTMTNAHIVAQDTHAGSALHTEKCGECGKDNHFKAACRSSWRWEVIWHLKMLNEVHHYGETGMKALEDPRPEFWYHKIKKYISWQNKVDTIR